MNGDELTKACCSDGLEGTALDRAVAVALGVGPGAAYSTDWGAGGPLVERYQIQLAAPQSIIHRHGGPSAGNGPAGFWRATSWVLRRSDGRRGFGFHESSPLVAAMRLIADCLGHAGGAATP